LHPKHVEQGKCNKVTLNNLHQAGLNKPINSQGMCKIHAPVPGLDSDSMISGEPLQ